MNIWKNVKLTGFVLCAAAALAGCGKKNEDKVRVAYFPNITHSQALVMKSQGLLEEKLGESAEVDWISFNAGPAEVEAIFAGEIDMGYIGPVPAISAYIKSQGDVQIIAGAANAGAVLVVRDGAGIESVEDLDGKNVSIPQLGNTQHLSLLNLMKENGLKTKAEGGTVNVVAASNADVANLMDQDNIDAALVPEPWGTILEQNGAKVLLDYDQVWMEGNYATAVVVVRKEFLEEHRDVVEKFIEAHQESTDYINANPKEAGKLANQEIEEATQKGIEDEVLQRAYERLIFSTVIPEASITEFAKLNKQEGFIDELPNEDIIDSSLLK
ncbi:MAG: aliphatic sulfonate ABC transporter substrate-binding protein [Lachnospiraceae bacterium]|nr:aliphatic sulfonate ABC transporter substrate-binding protein [Lachnospiraceae bacterium]